MARKRKRTTRRRKKQTSRKIRRRATSVRGVKAPGCGFEYAKSRNGKRYRRYVCRKANGAY